MRFFFSFAFALSLLGLIGCNTISPPLRVKPSLQTLTVTGYCNCKKCCGWERSWVRLGAPVFASGPQKGERKEVGLTASGRKARTGTAAVDRSLFPLGTVFYVPGYGYARGEDVGGAIKGNHIDLWFPSHQAALEWGKQTLPVTVWKK
ncbi:MAG: 3D domain-containing protein [Kiritimatiellia bacterium]